MQLEPLEGLKRKLYESLYRRAVSDVRDTGPVVLGNCPMVLASMVRHKDVMSYLVAVKSFVHHALKPTRIALVCDEDVTREDRDMLCQHIPAIELIDVRAARHKALPKGGTWERLFAISQLAKSDYVIQLDADTLTTGPLAEVRQAVLQGCSFAAGEAVGQELVSIEDISRAQLPRASGNCNVQTLAEANLSKLGYPKDRMYLRGCSGFSGFPKSQDLGAEMLEFSERMWDRLGARWEEWGTEQVSSNFLVAGYTTALVLRPPKYGYPDSISEATEFIHFIGTHRFGSRTYERMSMQFLRGLA